MDARKLMKLQTLKVVLSCALLSAVVSQTAAQTAKNGKNTSEVQTKSVQTQLSAQKSELFWFDGMQKRSLQMIPDQIAQFSSDGKVNFIPSILSNAASQEKSTNANNLRAESPLFTDAGKRRALPGGMIVTLQSAANPADAKGQLVAAGLTPIRMLNIQYEQGANASKVWLVASNPGIESLNLANELHASGKFASVQPNWWVQRALK